MTRLFALDTILAAALAILLVLVAGAQPASHTYLPVARTLLHAGILTPPAGIICQLQTGAAIVTDPRTGDVVASCEAKHGHGMVVWSGSTLLLDHVAAGSGSLAVIDGAVWVVAVRDDGAVQVAEVPRP
jgi:putative hemolysin